MIGIYYSLLFALQEYINNAGYSKNDIFKSAETVYVFSKGNTPKEIITFLKDLFIKAVDSIARLRQSRNRLDIQAICRYINENYMTGISLEETADHFHVTKEYLSKAFRDETKTKFTDYVTTMRIRKAYDLLCNYDAPIKDVAEMVGYVDLAHFHKNFKRILGKTPGEVKESLKNDKETSN